MVEIPESTKEYLDQVARGIRTDATSTIILEIDGQEWSFYDEDGVTRYRLASDDDQR